jgi:phenylalanyl-tRNA synthetase beta chain
MKLSLAWIFDHINADWKKQNIENLVTKFNQITAEIEDYYPVSFKLNSYVLGEVQGIDGDEVSIFVPEKKKEIVLPMRDDIKNLSSSRLEDTSFMIHLGEKSRWAECKDFGLRKEGYLPAFGVEGKYLDGSWRELVESEDIILEVDNKSLTHRPDMWGHRGFAREVAAFLDLEFLPKRKFLATKSEKHFENISKASPTNPFVIENKAPQACHRFSGLYFESIENGPAELFMTMRLLKVGVRSINALVDLTNYVMLDWSQPTHAFDAAKIQDKKIIIRMAEKGEKLTLLDDAKLDLTNKDLVICDPSGPMALAGVMGGVKDSLSEKTSTIFLESANFDAAYVRRSAFRHKLRTESSSRFEKTLDPNQITDAILRFLALAEKFNISFECSDEIAVLGAPLEEKIIDVSQNYLSSRSGVEFSDQDVIESLKKIGFSVEKKDDIYTVVVPSFRCAKDVKAKEDILEEVTRLYGYGKIKLELPRLLKKPIEKQPALRIREIKEFFAFSANMDEQQNYSFFDESFLAEIGYAPKEEVIKVINPISQNYTKLITTLLVGLFKNVKDNFMVEDQLDFFEWGRVWHLSDGKPFEDRKLAGIFFNKRKEVDFYNCKSYISQILNILGIKAEWKKVTEASEPWQNPYQTAEIIFEGRKIGVAGKVDKTFLSKLDVLPESDAFVFELDADLLRDFQAATKKYIPISKYQQTSFDLSFFVPLNIQTKKLEDILWNIDPLVKHVSLFDFFEKDDWKDKRALSFRVRVGSGNKTLEKEEIENVRMRAVEQIEKTGAVLRS